VLNKVVLQFEKMSDTLLIQIAKIWQCLSFNCNVIPAEAGRRLLENPFYLLWMPAFAGMTLIFLFDILKLRYCQKFRFIAFTEKVSDI